MPKTNHSGTENIVEQAIDLIKSKKYIESLELIEQGLVNNSKDEALLDRKGEVLMLLNRYKEAIDCFDFLIPLVSNTYFYWLRKGDCHKKLMQYELSLECYDKSISMRRNNLPALIEKGMVLNLMERFDEANVAIDRALEISPDDPKLLKIKIEALYTLGRFEEGGKLAKQAIGMDSKLIWAWFYLGRYYISRSDHEEIARCQEKLVELDPRDPDAWLNLGIAYKHLGLIDKGKDCYKKYNELRKEEEIKGQKAHVAFEISENQYNSIIHKYQLERAVAKDWVDLIKRLYPNSKEDQVKAWFMFMNGWDCHRIRMEDENQTG